MLLRPSVWAWFSGRSDANSNTSISGQGLDFLYEFERKRTETSGRNHESSDEVQAKLNA